MALDFLLDSYFSVILIVFGEISVIVMWPICVVLVFGRIISVEFQDAVNSSSVKLNSFSCCSVCHFLKSSSFEFQMGPHFTFNI